jgi:hypothetical protein
LMWRNRVHVIPEMNADVRQERVKMILENIELSLNLSLI